MTQPNYPPPGDPQSEGWSQPTSGPAGYPTGQEPGYGQPAPSSGQPDPYAQTDPYAQQAYAQPGYPQPGYPAQFYVQKPPDNSLALIAMIVSICGLVMCPLVGIVGAIMGHKSRAQLRQRGEGGESYATIAIIVGWISFGILVGIILLYAVIIGGVFATGGFEDTSSTY